MGLVFVVPLCASTTVRRTQKKHEKLTSSYKYSVFVNGTQKHIFLHEITEKSSLLKNKLHIEASVEIYKEKHAATCRRVGRSGNARARLLGVGGTPRAVLVHKLSYL